MAISTYGIKLCRCVAGTWSGVSGKRYYPIVDIKDFPDLGGSPEMLETTTMSDAMQTYIPGIQKLDGLDFTANYDKSVYDELKTTYEGKDKSYYVVFGGDFSSGSLFVKNEETENSGNNGIFSFYGKMSVHIVGAGVNEVVNMLISIAPSSSIDFSKT